MRAPRRWVLAAVTAALPALLVAATACDGGGAPGAVLAQPTAAAARTGALTDSAFAALVARLSEPGGYFDTDNLISNESGYLKVVGALERMDVRGGAYVGVAPDQNFSYVARTRPELAFMLDIRRDNLLHHLLLKALMEGSPTRVEFLAALLGKEPPEDPPAWTARPVEELVAWADAAPASEARRRALDEVVAAAVVGFGVPVDEADLATVRRFHHTFMDAGLDLRFTTFGRPPRPYYPTLRQLVLETDLEGTPASYLAREEDYAFVRGLQVDNRIIPVVGDLAGPHAVRELGRVLAERGLRLSAFYTSNVEYYLWGGGTFQAWTENLAALPAHDNAVVIRSYFPNFGGTHPSAVPGYYATQALQPVATLVRGGFAGYWDVVTRDVLPLR